MSPNPPPCPEKLVMIVDGPMQKDRPFESLYRLGDGLVPEEVDEAWDYLEDLQVSRYDRKTEGEDSEGSVQAQLFKRALVHRAEIYLLVNSFGSIEGYPTAPRRLLNALDSVVHCGGRIASFAGPSLHGAAGHLFLLGESSRRFIGSRATLRFDFQSYNQKLRRNRFAGSVERFIEERSRLEAVKSIRDALERACNERRRDELREILREDPLNDQVPLKAEGDILSFDAGRMERYSLGRFNRRGSLRDAFLSQANLNEGDILGTKIDDFFNRVEG